MLAMQYSFTLPADYDMAIIDRRVAEKGHFLDRHPPLIFKAYLAARRDDAGLGSRLNLYAPFYLWQDAEGMTGFLTSPGFAGVAAAFGWPSVEVWPSVIALEHKGSPAEGANATREIVSIPRFSDLTTLRAAEDEAARRDTGESGAVLALTAFEPTGWSLVRFRLWRAQPATLGDQAYRVLHVSNPTPVPERAGG